MSEPVALDWQTFRAQRGDAHPEPCPAVGSDWSAVLSSPEVARLLRWSIGKMRHEVGHRQGTRQGREHVRLGAVL
jgi:hypothetical protein